MDWSQGYTARFYLSVVDPNTWGDIYVLDQLEDGSISLSDESLRGSADITCRELDLDSELWLRIYMEARKGNFGDAERVALFTGLPSSPKRQTSHNDSISIQCYSVLKPASDVLMPLGWYTPAGTNAVRKSYDLLREVIPAPIIINSDETNSVYLEQDIVAESGETYLSMVDYMLSVINYRLRIEGDGTIIIAPQPDVISAEFSALENDVMEPEVTVDTDWFDCPNVFRASSEGMYAVARDEDPESPLSIVNRGREIWMEDTDVTLNAGETIAQYADRRLREEQQIVTKVSYDRRFDPDVKPTDLVRLTYNEFGINGVFQVISQRIELTHGAPVSEEVVQI